MLLQTIVGKVDIYRGKASGTLYNGGAQLTDLNVQVGNNATISIIVVYILLFHSFIFY